MRKSLIASFSWAGPWIWPRRKSEEIVLNKVLDEIKETGIYVPGIGDWGYMPTTPRRLKAELDKRHLDLLGGFCSSSWVKEDNHEQRVSSALKVGRAHVSMRL